LNFFITWTGEEPRAGARSPTRASRAGRRAAHRHFRSRTRTSSAQRGEDDCGSKILGNFIAPYDAHVIEQFNKSGR